MQAIKLALILSVAALPLAAQAKQPARQTAGLPQFIRSINRDAPIKSGPITIRRATAQGGNILIDAAIDSQLLPLPPAAERAPTVQALQTLAEAAWCRHPQFPALNPTRGLTIRYTVSGETDPINITVPAGRCAQIQSSQSPAEQEENGQTAALILLIPGMNQRLPLTDGNLTLQRVRFDHAERTMHKYLTLNDPNLVKQPAAQIRAAAPYRYAHPDETLHSGSLKTDARCVAVAAIARPQRFFDSLAALGFPLAQTLALPDHAAFDTTALPAADYIFVTEKDAAKLPPPDKAPANIWVLPIDAQIAPDLAAWVLARLDIKAA